MIISNRMSRLVTFSRENKEMEAQAGRATAIRFPKKIRFEPLTTSEVDDETYKFLKSKKLFNYYCDKMDFLVQGVPVPMKVTESKNSKSKAKDKGAN